MKKFLVGLMTVLFCLCLAACAPANVEKAKDKLKDAGYTIVSATEDAVPGVEGSVGSITAMKGADTLMGNLTGEGDMIVAVLFESSSAAKAYYNEHKDEAEEEEDQIVKQDGKWVYSGTEDAIKAFTK